MVNAQSIYFGSDEITSVYYGGNLVWSKPEEEGNWFIGVTSDGNPYNVKLNGSTISVNSGEQYNIEGELTSANEMFYGCTNLTSLDLSHLDTSNVTDMQSMFNRCTNLTSLDLSHLDTSNVTDMQSMFEFCTNLTSLDLSQFNTSKVKEFGYMFYECYTKNINISNFKFNNNPYISSMFACCRELTTLTLTGINFESVKYFTNFIRICPKLTTVIGPISGIKSRLNGIDLSSPPLTHDSAMVFINGLANVSSTQTLTFKSTTYDTLTPEEIALATSKGWSVVRS